MLTYDFLEMEPYFEDLDLSGMCDNMTGLLDRESVEQYAQYLVQEKRPFSLVICDLDNFKIINDVFGHSIGDKTIAFFSEILTEIYGDKGIIGRYEGDSFIVIIPDIVDYDGIWQVGYLALQYISQVRCELIEGRLLTYTVGLSRYTVDSDSLDDLYVMADKALYRGKLKGRNCFIIYLPEKHASIYRTTAQTDSMTTMSMHAKVASVLSDHGNLRHNIAYLLEYFVNQLMIDHMALQGKETVVLEKVHPLSDVKHFFYIPENLIESNLNDFGMCYINDYTSLEAMKQHAYIEELRSQGITASCNVRIAYNDVTYGYLRADSSAANGRIWQTSHMDLLVNLAGVIGLVLHYENITLEEL